MVRLAPDVVVMCDEENRREDADALAAAGVAVHSCSPRSVAEVGPALVALAGAVGAAPPELPPVPEPRAARASGLRADLAPPVDVDGRGDLRVLGARRARRRERVRRRGRPVPGGGPRRRAGAPARRRPRALGALSVPGPAPRRARGGRAGAARRRPGPLLVGRAHPGGARPPPPRRSACGADDAGAGRRPRPASPRRAHRAASARRRSPRSRHRSCGRRARRRSRRAGPRARRPPARTPRSRRGGWRGWPPAARRARRRRPRGSATAVSRTRWFSVSTWRARRRSTASSMDRSSPGRASRSGPMWASAASHSRRRSAYAEPARVRGTPECTTTTSTSPGSGTGSIPRSWQSMRSAWPATPAAEVSWSMIPQGTPDAACSARCPSRASARGSGVGAEGEGQRELERCARGEAGTHRQGGGDAAAQPLPGGDLGDDAGHVGRPGGRVGRPRAVQADDRRLRLGVRAELHPVASAGPDDRRAEVDRQRQHEPPGGVGVVAHEVDAARRERGDLRHRGTIPLA